MKYKLKQCIFYLNVKRKLYKNRTLKYNKINKIMNKIKKHLKMFALNDKISCLHLKCKAVKLIMLNIIIFKSYIIKMHKILLRV